jgi:hypothetical protein
MFRLRWLSIRASLPEWGSGGLGPAGSPRSGDSKGMEHGLRLENQHSVTVASVFAGSADDVGRDLASEDARGACRFSTATRLASRSRRSPSATAGR